MTTTKTLHRPARITSNIGALEAEMRSARWTYHRLLDFEDLHQTILDVAADRCAPGIDRVGRLLAILRARKRRAERSTDWSPSPHPAWERALVTRLKELKKQRDSHPLWGAAMRWADTPGPRAPARGGARRRKGESDEAFAARCATRRDRLTRREQYRAELYEKKRIYWGSWNALLASVDQARRDVIKLRKQGLPSDWSRPRWDDPITLAADPSGFRIVARDGAWWTIDQRLNEGWVRYRAKAGNWHEIPDGAKLRTCKLTRRKDVAGWTYSVSIAVAGMPIEAHDGHGVVGLDWGHREHGHPRESEGIRAWVWAGDDGQTGEIIVPRECRDLLDEVQDMRSRLDEACAARHERERNRYRYRSRLMLAGTRTADEDAWLRWEARQERRITAARRRIDALRAETYHRAVRELRSRYGTFVVEANMGRHMQVLDTAAMSARRKRQNRDLVARYEFVKICERHGATVHQVSARNTSRTCPDCGTVGDADGMTLACAGCGTVRDRDIGAARNILKRGQEELTVRAA